MLSRYGRRCLIVQGWIVVLAGTIGLPVLFGLGVGAALPRGRHSIPTGLVVIIILPCILLAKFLASQWSTPEEAAAEARGKITPETLGFVGRVLPWTPLLVLALIVGLCQLS